MGAILDDAKPMSELVNTAIGGDFINPDIIAKLSSIIDDVRTIRKTISSMHRGVTESAQIAVEG